MTSRLASVAACAFSFLIAPAHAEQVTVKVKERSDVVVYEGAADVPVEICFTDGPDELITVSAGASDAMIGLGECHTVSGGLIVIYGSNTYLGAGSEATVTVSW